MINKNNIPEKFRDHPIFNELVVGMNYGFMAKRGYYNTEYAKKQPKLMADMGINWVTLNANFCVEHLTSTRCFLDFEYSSTETELIEMAKRMHDNGIHVMLKPCMTPLDGSWMGKVHFPNDSETTQINGVKLEYWKKFFDSFKECSKYFAEIADKCGIEAYLIGAEYFGTENQNKGWSETIDVVRENYGGPISYEFTPKTINEETYSLEWLNKLDFLSFSTYPPAQPKNKGYNPYDNPEIKTMPCPSLEDMIKYLEPNRDYVQKVVQRFNNKPILFTEIGARSSRGNTIMPYNFRWSSIYDGEEQANYMEAVFRTYTQMDNWMGLLWWKWDETQDRPHYSEDPAGDQGFTIQGKPAEQVFKSWLGKLN